MFRKISIRRRLTLMAALAVTAACIVLTAVISTSATIQLDQLGAYVVEVRPTGEEAMEIDLGPNLIMDGFPDTVASMKYTFRLQSLLAMLGVVLITSGFTWVLAGRVLDPLRRLNEAIDRTNAQNLAEPLEVPDTNDEIAELTVSCNRMLERLNRVFVAQKSFTSNAAHEFHTPLAVMRTKLDIFSKKKEHTQQEYDEIFHLLGTYTDRMRELLDQLLEMANMQTVAMEDMINLDDLLDEILCDLADMAEKRNVELIKDGQDSENGIIKGNDTLIYRAFYNLIENAVKYNIAGGTAAVKTAQAGERIRVEISDTGIGIPGELRERVFEPFYQVDQSRSRKQEGLGLGLAIVKAIVEQHKGKIEINENENGGTVVSVELCTFKTEKQEL